MLGRRALAERFRLHLSFGWEVVLAVCTQLAASGINLPFDLRRITPSEAHHLALESPIPVAMRAIWSASRTDPNAARTSEAE